MSYPMYGSTPMYGNNQMYIQDLQNMRDRIDQQMRQMQQPMQPMQNQPPAINQTFQLAPNQTNSELEAKYANDIEEVRGTLIFKNTLFANKDMTMLWVKNVSGDVKTYTITEVIEIDPKDKEIAELKKQIEEMKKPNIQQEQQSTDLKIEKKK